MSKGKHAATDRTVSEGNLGVIFFSIGMIGWTLWIVFTSPTGSIIGPVSYGCWAICAAYLVRSVWRIRQDKSEGGRNY